MYGGYLRTLTLCYNREKITFDELIVKFLGYIGYTLNEK